MKRSYVHFFLVLLDSGSLDLVADRDDFEWFESSGSFGRHELNFIATVLEEGDPVDLLNVNHLGYHLQELFFCFHVAPGV